MTGELLRFGLTAPVFKRLVVAITGLIFITYTIVLTSRAVSGAWVAGLDAGLIYNEFPFMGTGLIPADMWALSTPSPQNPVPKTIVADLTSNPSAVQFNHRVLVLLLGL
jgi:cytochrome c oxidase assembly protein subunit 15